MTRLRQLTLYTGSPESLCGGCTGLRAKKVKRAEEKVLVMSQTETEMIQQEFVSLSSFSWVWLDIKPWRNDSCFKYAESKHLHVSFGRKHPVGTAAPAGQSLCSLTPAGSRASGKRWQFRDKGSNPEPVYDRRVFYLLRNVGCYLSREDGKMCQAVALILEWPLKWLTPFAGSPPHSRSLQ